MPALVLCRKTLRSKLGAERIALTGGVDPTLRAAKTICRLIF